MNTAITGRRFNYNTTESLPSVSSMRTLTPYHPHAGPDGPQGPSGQQDTPGCKRELWHFWGAGPTSLEEALNIVMTEYENRWAQMERHGVG